MRTSARLNLGCRGQTKRLRVGLLALLGGLVLTILLFELQAPPAYRALLVLPFALAAFGASQGLLRTCPMQAHLGLRETDHGTEVIAEPEARERVRATARTVVIWSVLGAVLVTLPLLFLPS